jgi:hypothetical protein
MAVLAVSAVAVEVVRLIAELHSSVALVALAQF